MKKRRKLAEAAHRRLRSNGHGEAEKLTTTLRNIANCHKEVVRYLGRHLFWTGVLHCDRHNYVLKITINNEYKYVRMKCRQLFGCSEGNIRYSWKVNSSSTRKSLLLRWKTVKTRFVRIYYRFCITAALKLLTCW